MDDNNNNAPNRMKRAGLLRRIKLFFQAWMLKISVATMFKLMRITGAAKLKPTLPEYTKRYPVRPMLEHRVFLPPDHAEREARGEKLPLLISIHGGVCSPFLTALPYYISHVVLCSAHG